MKKNKYSAKTGSSIGLSLLLLSSHSLVLGDAQGSSPDTMNHAPAINMDFNYPGI